MRWAVGLLLLANCRAVFGLDSPELIDAPSDSVPPQQVTGKLLYRYLENDALGRPALMESAFEPADVTIKVTQNGTTTSVDVATDGSFSFARSDGTYWLDVRTPSRSVIYELSSDHPELIDQFYGRPDPVPVAPQTSLNVNVANRPGGGFAEYLASSGVYSLSPFKQGFNWSSAVFYGPPGLLEASHHDRLYYLAANSINPNTLTVTYAASAEITVAAGQTTQVSLTAVPVQQNLCARFNAAVGTEISRVEAAVPSVVGAKVGQVSIRSTAAFVTGMGISLYGEASTSNLNKSVAYGDPFNWDRFAMMYAGVQHTIGTTAVIDAAQVYVPVTNDCFTETNLSAGLVALPMSFQLAGTQITDGTKITLTSSTAVTLSWTTTGERADYFIVNLFPVSLGLDALAGSYVTPLPTLTLDPAVLARGQAYTVQITAVRGVPNAGAGDFRTVEQTTAYGTVFSPVFSVD
jgi:hypothetical protein